MSVVTGVTLQYKDNLFRQILPTINKWLEDRKFPPLISVENHYGGTKHPQVSVVGAGYNYFPEEEFAQFICGLAWDMPENCVLLLNPEEGGTQVVRPC